MRWPRPDFVPSTPHIRRTRLVLSVNASSVCCGVVVRWLVRLTGDTEVRRRFIIADAAISLHSDTLMVFTRAGNAASGRGAKYCDECVCSSVCLSVHPLAYLVNHKAELHQFLCVCVSTVAQSSSRGVAEKL